MLTGTREGMQEMKDVIKLVEAIRQLAGPDPVQVDITLRVAKVIGYQTVSRAIMEAVEGTSYIEQLRQGTPRRSPFGDYRSCYAPFGLRTHSPCQSYALC